ncbi:presqualene diphosphate synthase HpnD [Methylocystis parvus]|uniref:Presqualene diphosphate synthase HpnD n=1 Tax=Methylocystis parvus TaxID=134 RepID=A0A6B8M7N6_9HYPH|nr:presqualene diphosphate synthase HpnD [Methylocystis parvus]QGM97962.1 presqualene diphosphate synthase HpnD [Methylocystis parvus]WBK01724.1 presqualene diphosphate synthase HpnD [Methylocystis parvus OBBP]
MTMQSLTDAAPLKTQGVAVKSSFYLAMRILEPARRDAMYAIYAFCRAVDDIADDEGDRDARREALDRWRYDLDELYAGRIRPRSAFLAEPVRRFKLDRADFEAIIDGMAMDVEEDICAPDWEKLELYCDRVASAVGRLSVRAFGMVEEDEAELPTAPKLLAYHLGRALQLTNILRDLDEDAARGRLYLPREALAEAGVPSHAPHAVLSNPALDQVCAPVMNRAREHFEQADLVMAGLPKNAVKAPYLMAAGYRSILERLTERGFSPPRAPVSMSRLKLIGALVRHAFL